MGDTYDIHIYNINHPPHARSIVELPAMSLFGSGNKTGTDGILDEHQNHLNDGRPQSDLGRPW